MKTLLKLKHWQLFMLTWGAAIFISIFSMDSPNLNQVTFPIMMFLFIIGIFGWIYSIGSILAVNLPIENELDVKKFKIIFIIPIIYMLIILIGISTPLFHSFAGQGSSLSAVEVFLIFAHLFSMFAIIYGMRFAAKTIKTIELQRPAHFSDYVGEFFLIWFSPIGIWLLQVRINKLIEAK